MVGAQAVALRIAGDSAAFWGCGFFGAQDTLHDDRGRHYFKDCYIQGSIDFIFGNAKSFYEVIILFMDRSMIDHLYMHYLLYMYIIIKHQIVAGVTIRGANLSCTWHGEELIKRIVLESI